MKNSEILLITEAKNTNPNGDPGNDNQPRFTEDGRVEITDLRLKRYIRDYIDKYVDNYGIAVKKLEEVSDNNISSLLKEYVKSLKNDNEWNDEELDKEKYFLEKYIDIPLFGLVTGSQSKDNIKHIGFIKPNYYGTVQYQYGMSLNKPNLKNTDISPVTGTLGKDFRIDYGVFAFYGVVNKKTGEKYGLKDEIIKYLDRWTIKSIPVLSAETRSKIGQDVLLYLRVEYEDGNLPHDLRDFISISIEEDINSIKDYKINIDELLEYLSDKKSTVHYYKNNNLKFEGNGIPKTGKNNTYTEIKLKDNTEEENK